MSSGGAAAGDEASVSVVLATVGEAAVEASALASLARQLRPEDEVLVVGGAEPDAATLAAAPAARWVVAAEGSPVPVRWARGLDAARSELVVTTTVELEPLAGWLDAFRRAHASEELAGVGGPIVPPNAGAAALAVWALRYSGTWDPDGGCSGSGSGGPVEGRVSHRRRVADLAADNACYRRSWLGRYRDLWSAGFWEPEVHAPLIRDGGALAFDPSARLVLRSLEQPFGFARQRVVHGQRYGGWRARSWSRAMRGARLAAAGVVPSVLVARAWARARRAGIGTVRLAVALPWLTLFAGAWALGEARGVLGAMSARRSPGPS